VCGKRWQAVQRGSSERASAPAALFRYLRMDLTPDIDYQIRHCNIMVHELDWIAVEMRRSVSSLFSLDPT
jgi:hypothetical protein